MNKLFNQIANPSSFGNKSGVLYPLAIWIYLCKPSALPWTKEVDWRPNYTTFDARWSWNRIFEEIVPNIRQKLARFNQSWTPRKRGRLFQNWLQVQGKSSRGACWKCRFQLLTAFARSNRNLRPIIQAPYQWK